MSNAERESIEPEEAMTHLLRGFHRVGADAAAAMDTYELRLTTEAISRVTYTTAARAWREDVLDRLSELERAVADLIQRKER